MIPDVKVNMVAKIPRRFIYRKRTLQTKMPSMTRANLQTHCLYDAILSKDWV